MEFAVLQLGRNGALRQCVPRLGIVGWLTIDYVVDQQTGYPRKTARITELGAKGNGRDLLQPLLDPEIVRLGADGLVLRGRRPSTHGGAEDEQVWRCQWLPPRCTGH